MSREMRAKPTLLLICDLCSKEIREHDQTEVAARFTSGQVTPEWGRPVRLPETKHVRFTWPGPRRRRNEPQKHHGEADREWDFHGECFLRMVENATGGDR